MSLISDAILLARKDLIVEARARQAIASTLTLTAISLVVVGLAVGPDRDRLRSLAPSLVWIVLLYAAIAVADRLERIDRADDAFVGLWLGIADRRAIFLGRVISLSTALVVLQLAIWLGAAFLLDAPVGPASVLLVPLSVMTALGAGGATALTSALVAPSAHRALLLPVVLLPLLVPTLLAGVQAGTAVLAGRPADAVAAGAALLIETALFAGVGLLSYEVAAKPD